MQVPTTFVTFHQNIGMLVMRQTAHVSGYLCRRCATAYFKEYTLTTLLAGWWGMISFFVTPCYLINNLWELRKAQRLPVPPVLPVSPEMPVNIPFGERSQPIDAGSRKSKLINGAVIFSVVVGVGLVTTFVEKHRVAALTGCLMMASCTQSESLRTGALYSVSSETGAFGIAKILVLEPGVVHVKIYKQTFPTRPKSIDPASLTLGDMGDPDGFSIEHLPLARQVFLSWDPVFISRQNVSDAELEGYKMWKEARGGVFSVDPRPIIKSNVPRR